MYTAILMKSGVILGIALMGVGVSAQTKSISPDPQTALVKQYCTGCHSDRGKAGGLSLAAFDARPRRTRRRRREDGPQAARRHDAAARRPASARRS